MSGRAQVRHVQAPEFNQSAANPSFFSPAPRVAHVAPDMPPRLDLPIRKILKRCGAIVQWVGYLPSTPYDILSPTRVNQE